MKYCVCGYTYKLSNSEPPTVILSTRDESNRRAFLSSSYHPYFYTPVYALNRLNQLLSDHNLKDEVIDIQYGFKGIDHSKLAKITVISPKTISLISKLAKAKKPKYGSIPLYEAHVPFALRFLVDHGIVTGCDSHFKPVDCDSKHKLVFMDIETLPSNEHSLKSYSDPVIAASLYDWANDMYYTLVSRDVQITGIEVNNISLQCYSDEHSMLLDLIKCLSSLDADVIVTFSKFDVKYLVNRLKKLKLPAEYISPVKMLSSNSGLCCVDVLDYQELYVKVKGELLWNTLDNIAFTELGYGKISIPSIQEAWLSNPEQLVKYNIRDVKLLRDLEAKLNLISGYVIPIWARTGLPFSRCLKPSAISEVLYLRYFNGSLVLPPKHSPEEEITYKGAAVEANPGLYRNVAILDWNELYPSIMETFHISWETFSVKPDIKVTETFGFKADSPGSANIMIKPLRILRKSIKERLKHASGDERQYYECLNRAIKAIINSVYGMFKFYNVNIAQAITLLGRVVFYEVKRFLEKAGYVMLYGDTDSVFIQLKTDDPVNEANNLASSIQQHIAQFLKSQYNVESKLTITVDNICSSLLIISKKRYHGITLDGREIIKGLEAVRKDAALITVELEKALGNKLLRGGSIREAQQYIKELLFNIKSNPDVNKLALRVRCTKNIDDYKSNSRNKLAALACKALTGKTIARGDRFYLLYTKPFRFTLNGKEYISHVIGLKSLDDLKQLNNIVLDLDKICEITVITPAKAYIGSIVDDKAFIQQSIQSYLGDAYE